MVGAPVSDARERVLGAVRAALAGVPPEPPPRPEVPRDPGLPAGRDALAALLAERVAEYRASVTRAPEESAAEAVGRVLARHGARRVGVPADLPGALRPAGVELVPDDDLAPDALDRLDGALTGCLLAIADTGTIVLDGGPGQGRRALSLVPDLHVCVVAQERIVATLADAIGPMGRAAAARRALTLISGPSATSDIELRRVEGVHGPRRLEVVITGVF